MSKAKSLLFDLLILAFLLLIVSLPAFPQIEYREKIAIDFMIFGLILIIKRKGEKHEL